MIKLENCPICNKSEWEDLNYLRDDQFWKSVSYLDIDESMGFKICRNCAFVTYDYVPVDRLIEIYKRERKIINSDLIVTASRKIEYHKSFFKPVMQELLNNNTDIRVLDYGCAQGAVLKWLHDDLKIPIENLYGSEYSLILRAWAKNEYGLNVTENPDLSRKYDLIILYHVLEHLQYPDMELKKCVDALDNNGVIYISVPTWFNIFEETSGALINNFEHYYHLNHVNVFGINSYENIIRKCNLELLAIDKSNIYGVTGIYKKSNKNENLQINEKWEDIIIMMKRQKEAIKLVTQKKFTEAYNLEPKFIDAYLHDVLTSENMKSLETQRAILAKGLAVNPMNQKLLTQLAVILFQWDDNKPDSDGFYSNNIKEAEKLFKLLITLKPGNELNYYFLGLIEAKYKKNYDIAVEYMKKCVDINFIKYPEVLQICGNFWREKEKLVNTK